MIFVCRYCELPYRDTGGGDDLETGGVCEACGVKILGKKLHDQAVGRASQRVGKLARRLGLRRRRPS